MIASPESSTHIRSTSNQIRKDFTTGVCSFNEEIHFTQISKEMDGRITGEENSAEKRVQNIGIHGCSLENIVSQDKRTHPT